MTEVSVDEWDFSGSWYRILPPDSISKLFQEEQDMITISEESDGFWMSIRGKNGSDRFDTLAQAKEAGNKIVEMAESSMSSKMIEESGLDSSLWSFSYMAVPAFTHIHDNNIVILADIEAKDDPWTAWDGDTEMGQYESPKAAEEFLLNQPSIRL